MEQQQWYSTPEEIFFYIYAVLYSPTYRTKYAAYLKSDFARIPFTKDQVLFKRLVDLGKLLVDLHLVKSPTLDKPICRFHGKGNNRIEEQNYSPKEKRVIYQRGSIF
jgi:predicted helicase